MSKVEIIEFKESSCLDDSNKSNNKFRQFSSSKISKLFKSHSIPQNSQSSISESEKNMNALDISLLKTTTELINKITSHSLSGKDRLKQQQETLTHLTNIPAPHIKHPLPIRLGIQKKSSKALAHAKANYNPENITVHPIKPISKSNSKKKSHKKDLGIFGSIGTIKDGIMHVTKKQISSFEKASAKKNKRSRGFNF